MRVIKSASVEQIERCRSDIHELQFMVRDLRAEMRKFFLIAGAVFLSIVTTLQLIYTNVL